MGSASVHIRCAARATMLEALEAQARAQQSQAHAETLVDRARGLVSAARRMQYCAVCLRALASGGGVLYQGDRLVHALCWRPASGPPEPPAPDVIGGAAG